MSAEISPTSRTETYEDKIAHAKTMRANRKLIICAGGTGIEMAAAMAQQLKSQGLRFGDSSILVDRPGSTITDLVIVDTDAGAINMAADQDNAEAQQSMKINELQKMGAHTVKLDGKHSQAYIEREGLDGQLTGNWPPANNSMGARADHRVGLARTLAAMAKDDKGNPLTTVRRVVNSWQDPNAPRFGDTVEIIGFGGVHGGTGQSVAPVMLKAISMVEEALNGTTTAVTSTRIMMTAESATIDEKLSRKDINGLKRMANTGAGLVLANAMNIQGGFKLSPHDWVPGRPQFQVILNGATRFKKVESEGGHYTPARIAAKSLSAETMGIDLAGSDRNNAEARLKTRKDVTGPGGVNEPIAIFSVMGAAELRPLTSASELTAQKRRKIGAQVFGLEESQGNVVKDNVEALLAAKWLENFILAVKSPPALKAGQLGTPEEAKLKVRAGCDNWQRTVESKWPTLVNGKLIEDRDAINSAVELKAQEIKEQFGLATVKQFIIAMREALVELRKQAATQFEKDFPKDSLKNKLGLLKDAVAKIEKTSIPGFISGLLGNKKGDVIAQIGQSVSQLADGYTQYGEDFKLHSILTYIDEAMIAPLIQHLGRIEAQIDAEIRIARTLIEHVEPDGKEETVRTVFDLPVPVELGNGEDIDTLRKSLGKGEWSKEALLKVLESLNVHAGDIDLLQHLTRQALRETLAENSSPLSRPADRIHQPNAYSIARIGIPVDTKQEADRAPVPEGFTPVPTGKNGVLLAVQELHGLSLLDDAFSRECIKVLLALPPRAKQLARLAKIAPHDEVVTLSLSRETEFVWKGQSDELLPPVFKALAERLFIENARKGQVVESCPGEDCGVAYYRTPAQVHVGIANYCPGCIKLNKGNDLTRI